jgi:hypothetical protein
MMPMMKPAAALAALGLALLPEAGLAQQTYLLDPSLQRLRDAGGRIGELNVVLIWNTTDDLDLHIICPNGAKIYFGNKEACGGALDVDRNAGATTNTPVESTVWARPASGRYSVLVDPYSVSGRPVEYTLYVYVKGELVPEMTRRGTVSSGQRSSRALDFTYPLPGR